MKTAPLDLAGKQVAATPLVAIVVLAYNNHADTAECFRSIAAIDYPHRVCILVDNGSTDGTGEAIRDEFPQTQIQRLEPNRGVPGGFNAGIRAAIAAGAEHVVLLNNDTTIEPDFVRRLVEVAEHDPNVGIVMPKILYYSDPTRVWSVGARYRRFPPAIVFVGLGQPASQYDVARDLDFIPTCGLLIRRSTIEKLGLFDEGYRFHYDDYDFCVRARAAGMRIAYTPQARLRHKVSRTIRQRPDEFWRTWGESTARYYRRHGHPTALSLAVHAGYIAVRELVQGHGAGLPHFILGIARGYVRPLDPYPTLNDLAANHVS